MGLEMSAKKAERVYKGRVRFVSRRFAECAGIELSGGNISRASSEGEKKCT